MTDISDFKYDPNWKPSQPNQASGADNSIDDFVYDPNWKAPEPQGALSSGFKTSIRQIPQTLGGAAGLLGDAVGSEGLKNWGMNIYQKQSDKIAQMQSPNNSFSDVLEDKGDPVEWAKYGAGYLGGQALTAVGTGGVGGIIGKQAAKMGIQAAAKGAVEKGVAGAVADEAAKQALSRGAKIGAASALGANNFVQEAGQIYPDAVEQAQKDGRQLTGSDLARIGGSAAAAAGVDTLADAAMFHGLTHAGGSSAATFAKRALRTIPGGMLREGGTEGVQTAIERYGAGQDMTNQDAIRDYVDSAALGAFGGAAGGGASALHRAGDHVQTTQEAAPQAQPLALPAPTISVDAAGNAMTAGDRNADMQRRAAGDIYYDTTSVPQQEPLTAQTPRALGVPVFDVDASGNVITGNDRNAAAQVDLAERAARAQRVATGDITDVTPIDAAPEYTPAAPFQLAAPAINVDSDGTAATVDQRNTALQQLADTQADGFRDVTPVPGRADSTSVNQALLPAPTFTGDAAGNVVTSADRNAAAQADLSARADRAQRMATGDILDRTPVPMRPSEAMGLDPSRGSLSAAAAIAVDNGAHQGMTNAGTGSTVRAGDASNAGGTGAVRNEAGNTAAGPMAAAVDSTGRTGATANGAVSAQVVPNAAPQSVQSAALTQQAPQISPVISGRTDSQLQYLAQNGRTPDLRAQAQAEIARRSNQQAAPVQQQTGVQQDVTQATQAQQASPQPTQAATAPVAAANATIAHIATPAGLTAQTGTVQPTADHVQQMPAGQVAATPVASVQQQVEHSPVQVQPLTVEQAGQHWDQMSPANRNSVAMQADGLNKLQRANVHTAAWGKINSKVQQALTAQINQRFAESQPVAQQQEHSSSAKQPAQQEVLSQKENPTETKPEKVGTENSDPRELIKSVGKEHPFLEFKRARLEADMALQKAFGKSSDGFEALRGNMMRDPVSELIRDGQYEGAQSYAEKLPVDVSTTGISRSTATRAFSQTSFDPERRADSIERGTFYSILGLWQKFETEFKSATPEVKAEFVDVFNSASDRYKAAINAYLGAHSRVASSMITGPARFPTESNRRKSETADRRLQEASEVLEKAEKKLRRVLTGRIDNSLQAQISDVQQRLENRQAAQEHMKAVNAAHARYLKDSASLDSAELSEADKQQIREYKPKYGWIPHPYAPFELTNNNAEIHRLQDRVKILTNRNARAEASIQQEQEGSPASDPNVPVRLVQNAQANRVQLFFKGKPSEEIRNDLKSSGFKWSPSQGAWQRQLTANGIAAANGIVRKHFPSEGTSEQAAQQAPSGPMFSRAKSVDQLGHAVAGQVQNSFGEARQAIQNLIGDGVHPAKLIENRQTGMAAMLSGNNVRKILNSKAVEKSEEPSLHTTAVANIEKLFENAIYGWKKPDRKLDPNIIGVHRFFCVLDTPHGPRLTKLTVKEFVAKDQGNRIYSIEAVDINEKSPAAQWVDATIRADGLDPTSIRSARDVLNLAQEVEKGNKTPFPRPAAEQEGSDPQRSTGLSADAYDTARRVLLGDQEPKSTVAGVQQELTGKVGTLGDRIHVVQSVLDLPPAQRRQLFSSYGGQGVAGVQGVYFPDSQHAFMIADNIAPGHAYATLLHEAGVHAGMRGMIGDEGMHTLSSQIRAWAESGQGEEGRIARAAMDRIPGDTRSHQQDEELIAYFVEEAAAAGHGDVSAHGPIAQWFQQLWDYVRAAVAKLGGNPEQLTADDIVALAQGAMERVANGRTQEIMKMRPAGENSVGPIFGNIDGLWLDPQFEIRHGESDFDRGGFAEHGLMGHLSQTAEGAKTYGFNILDHLGKSVGYLAGDVKNGRIVSVHDIEIGAKSQGIGSRVIAGLTANGPVKAADILDQSENFWRKHGAERDWNGNGQANWAASQRNLDRQPGSRTGEGSENAAVSGMRRADQTVQTGSDGVLSDADRRWLEENSQIDGDGEGIFFASRAAETAGQTAAVGENTAQQILDGAKAVTSPIYRGVLRNVHTQLHKAITNPAFGAVFKNVENWAQQATRSIHNAASLAPDILHNYDDFAGAWHSLKNVWEQKDLMPRVWKMLEAGTLAGDSVLDGKRYTPAELKKMFGATDKELALVDQARAAIDASLDESSASVAWVLARKDLPAAVQQQIAASPARAEFTMRDAYEEAIAQAKDAGDRKLADTLQEHADQVASIFERGQALKDAGYVPLMRFGKYAVTVKNADGSVAYFGKYETGLQMQQAQHALRAQLKPGQTIESGPVNQTASRLWKGIDPESVALFIDRLGSKEDLGLPADLIDQAKQEWLKVSAGDRSAMARAIHRKGTPGFSTDLQRVLSQFVTSSGRMAARNYYNHDIMQSIQDIPQHMGDVQQDAQALKEYIDNPADPYAPVRGLMFGWYMGGSIASALVNLTQPVMMTLPYLSQYGVGKAAAALKFGTANALRKGGAGLSPEMKAALQRASDEGLVDPNEVHAVFAAGMDSMFNHLPGGERVQAAGRALSSAWGSMFAYSESLNRRASFLAAYKMASEDPKILKNGQSAFDFAVDAVKQTQGVNAKFNRPNWARGTGPFGVVGAAAFTFKTYSINYVELVKRLMTAKNADGSTNWQSVKAGSMMLGLLVLASGMNGAPGADDADDLIDTILQGLGYNGNMKRIKREALSGMVGDGMADLMLNGLSAVSPIDVQGRMGMANLIPATGILKNTNRDKKAQQLAELFGAPGNLANAPADAWEALQAGRPADVFSAFMPLAVRNGAKALEMAQTGEYKNTKGANVQAVTGGESLAKAIGFQPASVAAGSRVASEINQDATRMKDVLADANALFAQGVVQDDPEMKQSAQQKILDWNSQYPDARIGLNIAAIAQKVRQMRMDRDVRTLKTLPRGMRQSAAQRFAALNEPD